MVGGGIVKEGSHVLRQKGTPRTTFSKKLRFEEDFSYFTTIRTLLKQGEEELLSIYPQYSTTRCSFTSAYVIRHTHTSAYVILIRPHKSAYISIRIFNKVLFVFEWLCLITLELRTATSHTPSPKYILYFWTHLRAARNTVVIVGILRNSRNFLRDQAHLPLNYWASQQQSQKTRVVLGAARNAPAHTTASDYVRKKNACDSWSGNIQWIDSLKVQKRVDAGWGHTYHIVGHIHSSMRTHSWGHISQNKSTIKARRRRLRTHIK